MAITISGQNNNDKILASDGVLDSISGFNVVGVMTAAQFDVTGKTTTNHISIGDNIHLGNAGIITATTLIGNVTGNINHASNLLLQVGGSEKFRISSAGQLGIGGNNYGTAGQVLTSQGNSSAVTWSTIDTDKITEGNTEAEVVDTGSDGHFKVTTEGSERLRVSADGNLTVGAAVTISPVGNINATGIITATSYRGDGSQLTGITAGTALSGSTNNTLVTVTGANAITGESTLTYNGSDTFELQPASATPAIFIGDSNRTGANQGLAQFRGNWNGTTVARITFDTGDDTTNKDDGIIRFDTAPSGSLAERLRITREGYLYIRDNGVTQTNTTLSYQSEGAFLTHYTARTTAGGDRYRRMFDIASVGANPWGSSIRFLTSADSTNPAVTVERVRIDHNGRVGINKSTPQTMLSIKAERSAVPRFGIDGHYSDSSYTQSTWDDSSGLYTVLGVNHKLDANGNDATPVSSLHSSSIMLDGRSGNIRFFVKPNTGTSFTEALRITDTVSVDVKQKLNVDYTVSGSDFVAKFINQNANCYGVQIKQPASANAGYPLLSIANDSGGSHFRVDSGGLVYGNSGTGTDKPAYFVRAWVQGNSGTTNGSGGLSSMSRVGTGRFQLNFTTTMPDDNYAVGCLANNNYDDTSWFDTSDTDRVRVYFYTGSSYVDPSEWSAWVIR